MSDQISRTGKAQRPAVSHLFLVRLWEEPADGTRGGEATTGDGALASAIGTPGSSWKGKVQHVVSGESHAFQDLPSLVEYLLAMMPGSTPGAHVREPTTTE